jgi:ATP-dependent Clp protease ATP-binding subunit ClpC
VGGAARVLAEELRETADVLYADDLASLVFAGRTGDSDNNLARFLEPALARGELTVIAESTPERLAVVREQAPTFASLFRVVEVPPLAERATLGVLLGVLRDSRVRRRAASRRASRRPRWRRWWPACAASTRRRRCRGRRCACCGGSLAGPGKPERACRRFDVADVLGSPGRRDRPAVLSSSAPPRPARGPRCARTCWRWSPDSPRRSTPSPTW